MRAERSRVLLLSRYAGLGASSRVRMVQFLPRLEAEGFEVTQEPLLGDAYLRALYAGNPPNAAAIATAFGGLPA